MARHLARHRPCLALLGLGVALALAAGAQIPDLAEFPVNETPLLEISPTSATPADVALGADGRHVAAWSPDGRVVARHFAADGQPLSGDIEVGFGEVLHLAIRDAGRFLVVWRGPEGPALARLYEADGTPATDEVALGDEVDVAASSDARGNVVVARTELDPVDGTSSLWARRFTPAGEALTGPIRVQGHRSMLIVGVTVTSAPNGDFVVAWLGAGLNGEDARIFVRKVAADGRALSDRLRASAATSADRRSPAVAIDAAGRFTVAWAQDGEIFARRFAASGLTLGEPVRLSSGAFDESPTLSAGAGGEVLVAWSRFEHAFRGGYLGRYLPVEGSPGSTFLVSQGPVNRRPGGLGVPDNPGRAGVAGNGQGNFVVAYRRDQGLAARRLPAELRAGALHIVAASRAASLEPGLSVAENETELAVEVWRSGGSVGDVSVELSLDGDVRFGEDVRAAACRIELAGSAGTMSVIFPLELFEDEEVEGDEELLVRLSDPQGGAVLVAPSILTIRIVDDDFNPPELQPVRRGGEDGGERRVNVATGNHFSPQVAISPSARVSVGWQQAAGGASVRLRHFDLDGRPLGPPMPVADDSPELQLFRTLTYDDRDRLVVLWTAGEKLRGRRVDEPGEGFELPAICPEPFGPECHHAESPRLAPGRDGKVGVVWATRDRVARQLYFGVLDAGGGLSHTLLERRDQTFDAALAADEDGGFLVTYRRGERLHGVRIDDQLCPLNSFDFDLDAGSIFEPLAVGSTGAGTGAGRYLAAWQRLDRVLLGRFDHLGRRRGEVRQLSDFALGTTRQPVLAAHPEGHAVIVWRQRGNLPFESADGDGDGLFARRFNRAWGSVGGEFGVHAITAGRQSEHHAAMAPDGGLVVVWESRQADAETNDIFLQAFAPFTCVPGPHVLCLQDGRFRVEVDWHDFEGGRGRGRAAPLLTPDTGYFWFFAEDNVEIAVKVLDGRAFNDHYWVFYASLSNVGYTLRVTDTMTGAVRLYTNAIGEFASVADDEAFAGDELERDTAVDPLLPPPQDGACAPSSPTRLCLGGGRFEVEVEWRDFVDQTGLGRAVALTADTGHFWFFNDSNVEVILKVLDGTAINGHFWVFFGGLSDVEYTVTVRDTVTGQVKEYFNPLRSTASVGDTEALPGQVP